MLANRIWLHHFGRGLVDTPGDFGVLSKVNGAFQLREATGEIIGFRADGLLDFLQDSNGNRITAAYTGTQLTSLTHANGAALTLAGIVIFLAAGQRQGGTSHPSATAWWLACLATLAGVVILFVAGSRLAPADRALVLGGAAGLESGVASVIRDSASAPNRCSWGQVSGFQHSRFQHS